MIETRTVLQQPHDNKFKSSLTMLECIVEFVYEIGHRCISALVQIVAFRSRLIIHLIEW